jgi:hypothetical protein
MVRLYVSIKALFNSSLFMPKFIDRLGQKFGRLSVVESAGRDRNKKVLWKCLCDCGNTAIIPSGSLVTGNTTSCGCAFKDAVTKHGCWNKSSYNTWRAMMRRCYNVADKDYPKYGGRGISVFEPWHEYLVFAADMGEPSGDETLDRIDAYGNYEPKNCRWAGVKTQNRNVRVRANSKTGVTGVSKTNSGSYMAKITVGKQAFYSKCFATLEDAATARKELERLHWAVT